MEFRKSLAKYYHLWLESATVSAEYCRRKGENELAEQYDRSAQQYGRIIDENSKAIEFFSQDDRAFLRDEALPVEFRGYK